MSEPADGSAATSIAATSPPATSPAAQNPAAPSPATTRLASAGHVYEGRCHCGGIAMRLAVTRPADEMQVRACQCSFCTRHATLTISDPAGKATVEIMAGRLTSYKLGTGTATALICGQCGVCAGFVMAEGERLWSVANARGLGIEAFRDRIGIEMFYDDESANERIQRRKQKWTPTEIRFKL